MIQHDNKLKPGNPNWLPGQSGNPRGRPTGSRQKIADRALALVNDLIHTDAATASLNELMATDPGKFWSIVAGLLPRELEAKIRVQVAQPDNLDPEDRATFRRILHMVRDVAPGVPAGDVFDVIESALRSEFAKVIEHAPLAIEAPAQINAPRAAASPARPIQIDLEHAPASLELIPVSPEPIAALPPKPPY